MEWLRGLLLYLIICYLEVKYVVSVVQFYVNQPKCGVCNIRLSGDCKLLDIVYIHTKDRHLTIETILKILIISSRSSQKHSREGTKIFQNRQTS